MSSKSHSRIRKRKDIITASSRNISMFFLFNLADLPRYTMQDYNLVIKKIIWAYTVVELHLLLKQDMHLQYTQFKYMTYQLQTYTGVYILQNTMVVGMGEKNENWGCGEKN